MRVSDVSILITQTKVTSWAKMEDLAWSPLSHSHSHSICRALGLTTPRWNLHNCISSAYLHFKRRLRFLSLSFSVSPSLTHQPHSFFQTISLSLSLSLSHILSHSLFLFPLLARSVFLHLVLLPLYFTDT